MYAVSISYTFVYATPKPGGSFVAKPRTEQAWPKIPTTNFRGPFAPCGGTPIGQRKAAPPRLTLDRIVAAAVDIAAEEGLTALSMARLAERLECAPMSLYRHVANKDELQALMIDIAPGAPPDIDAADWREGLTRWAREMRAVYLRHPWILQIAISGPPREPGQLAWLESGLRALERSNLDPHDTMARHHARAALRSGRSQLSTTLLRGRKRSKNPDHDEWIDYSRTLSTLIDPARFPALAALIETDAKEPSREGTSTIADFDFGLARILDGVGALVDSSVRSHATKPKKRRGRRSK